MPARVRHAIVNAERVVISVASAWEYLVKQAKGDPMFDLSFDTLVSGLAHERLSFTFEHLAPLAGLPPIHGDPFDRMLVCQALVETLTIVTADAHIPRYPVETLW